MSKKTIEDFWTNDKYSSKNMVREDKEMHKSITLKIDCDGYADLTCNINDEIVDYIEDEVSKEVQRLFHRKENSTLLRDMFKLHSAQAVLVYEMKLKSLINIMRQQESLICDLHSRLGTTGLISNVPLEEFE